jgi:uncharacterized protein
VCFLTKVWGREPLFTVSDSTVSSSGNMRIQIAGLSEGSHNFHFEVTADDLALGERFGAPVAVDAKLDKTGSQLFLRASIRTTSSVECDRCITPFVVNLTPSYQMHYIWSEPDQSRFDPSEVQIIANGSTVIALDEDVRQTVLLSVPLKNLCRDDCKGLCPRCGKNLNEGRCMCEETERESRWDSLRSAAAGKEKID